MKCMFTNHKECEHEWCHECPYNKIAKIREEQKLSVKEARRRKDGTNKRAR